MIPLYGFLRGDTIGLLMLAAPEETVGALALRLQQSAAVRVRPRAHLAVLFKGQVLDPRATVERAGLTALDRFDVVPVEPT